MKPFRFRSAPCGSHRSWTASIATAVCALGLQACGGGRGDEPAAPAPNPGSVEPTPTAGSTTAVGRTDLSGNALRLLPGTLLGPTDLSFDGAGNLIIGSAQAILKARFRKQRNFLSTMNLQNHQETI